MTRGVDDAEFDAAKGHRVALADGLIYPRYLARLTARSNDLAACLGLEREVSSGMIGMMMRRQNMREAPAFLRQRAGDRSCLGRVDRRRQIGGGVVNEHAIIVAEAGKLLNLELSHGVRCSHLLFFH